MKTRLTWITFSLLAVVGLLYVYNLFRSSLTEEIIQKELNVNENNSAAIYLYGDSWVGNGSLDSYLANSLKEQGINLTVKSLGYPGANSKELYTTLLGKGYLKSAEKILKSKPQYCVVIVGVNDAASQLGPIFYAHHTSLILKALLKHEITPILLELPEFGIDETMQNLGVFIQSKNTLMALFNNQGETDNIVSYRAALHTKLKQDKLFKKIILVPFRNISTDYSKNSDIYKDEAHLSNKGQILLCKEIVKYLK